MRKKTIKNIYEELKDKKVEILNRLMKGQTDYYDNLKNEGGDLADEASDAIERELIYDLSITEKNEVDGIDTALKKIEDKTYGVCESCEQEIPIGRMEAKPYAKYCTKCQELYERNQKHHSFEQDENGLVQEGNE